MTQYIDHSYASCLNFAGNFKITCNSLITPLDIEQTAATYAAEGKTDNFTCETLESECYMSENNETYANWVSDYDYCVALMADVYAESDETDTALLTEGMQALAESVEPDGEEFCYEYTDYEVTSKVCTEDCETTCEDYATTCYNGNSCYGYGNCYYDWDNYVQYCDSYDCCGDFEDAEWTDENETDQ